ncbi:MAG: hypothetical protein MZV70_65135 [Desulfobacterales bacterium]|nr:hypothetical protein [Desulfobacterales bacterium]
MAAARADAIADVAGQAARSVHQIAIGRNDFLRRPFEVGLETKPGLSNFLHAHTNISFIFQVMNFTAHYLFSTAHPVPLMRR